MDFDSFDFFFLPGDVFLAPLFDAGERLRRLTGFSGSFAIAFLNTAHGGVFFTDNRYLLQVKDELRDGFEIRDIKQLSIWLEEVESSSVVFDPRLQTSKYDELLDEKLQLAPAEDRLLDEFYKKNLCVDLNKYKPDVYFYDEHFTGLSHQRRIEQFLETLEGDYFLILNPENVSWLLNIRSDNFDYNQNVSCFALVHYDGHVDLFLQNCTSLYIKGVNIHNVDDLYDLLRKRKIDSLSIDRKSSTVFFDDLLKNLKINVDYVDDPIYLMRAVKNDVEIDNFIDVHVYDGAAVTKFWIWMINNFNHNSNFNINERNAVKKLREFREDQPRFVRDSFATIAAFGKNGAIVHYNPANNNNETIINRDNLFLLDSGGHYLGGTTDVTRTMCLGEPCDEQKKHYTLVLKGNICLQNAIFPSGLQGCNLDMLARYYLLQHGLNYGHSTGHGVSNFLHVHEKLPIINKKDKTVLQSGMVISNEPGYYRESHYGIRLENLMLVCKRDDDLLCFRCLTQVPFALNLVDWDILERHEKEWIRQYNVGVFEKLSPFLGDDEKGVFAKHFLY